LFWHLCELGTPKPASHLEVSAREIRKLREQYPERHILRELSDDTRLVVCEPIGDLPGAWQEVPEATCGVVGKGHHKLLPVTPKASPNSR
jgi:hypothetical protein